MNSISTESVGDLATLIPSFERSLRAAKLSGVAGRTALGRLGRPDYIAEPALAVPGMHWFTGQSIECDGGLARHSPIDPTRRGAR